MYFSKFPLTVYDIKGNKNYTLLPDILRRVKIRAGLVSNRLVFDKYNVKEGEKQEDDSVHHYELAQTSGVTTSIDNSHMLEVNSDTDGATTITNREYEERVQDDLRQIKLLDEKYLTSFTEEFFALIRKNKF